MVGPRAGSDPADVDLVVGVLFPLEPPPLFSGVQPRETEQGALGERAADDEAELTELDIIELEPLEESAGAGTERERVDPSSTPRCCVAVERDPYFVAREARTTMARPPVVVATAREVPSEPPGARPGPRPTGRSGQPAPAPRRPVGPPVRRERRRRVARAWARLRASCAEAWRALTEALAGPLGRLTAPAGSRSAGAGRFERGTAARRLHRSRALEPMRAGAAAITTKGEGRAKPVEDQRDRACGGGRGGSSQRPRAQSPGTGLLEPRGSVRSRNAGPRTLPGRR